MMQVRHRAEIHLTENLILNLLGLADISILGAEFNPRTGNVALFVTGAKCPACLEGNYPTVVTLESLR